MKVIINASGYVGQSAGAGGAGVFLQHLVLQLAEVCDVDVLVAPNSNNFRVGYHKARIIELPYVTPDTLRHLHVGPTVVVDPYGGLPCGPFPDDVALCVILHDLMHIERPHFFTATERQGRSIGFAGGLQRADAVVTGAEDQARAIRHHFPGVEPVVIPHLPYLTLGNAGASGGGAALPAGLGRFVLFPGVKWPHKNHKTLMEAFDAYIKRTGSDLQLVMSGGPCAESRFSFFPSSKELSDQIVDLGNVSEEVLRTLYAEAEAVLSPTLYEGFGIPVLEAAYQGKMIVASGLAVFDEILGAATYRRVDDPLCHVRWMEALADIEGPKRALYESRAKALRQRVNVGAFTHSYVALLKACAERYTHPASYPVRRFPSGDRLTSSTLIGLSFTDLYGTAAVDHGPRHPALGAKPTTQNSAIFRSSAFPNKKQCLRAQYKVEGLPSDAPGSLQFSAWIRLLDAGSLDALHWSANDRGVCDILPMLRDGDWHLFRAAVPRDGYIDFRGLRGGQSEVSGFDLEVHDPAILRVLDLAPPVEEPLPRCLTVFVAALTDRPLLDEVVASVAALNATLPSATSAVSWVVVTRVSLLGNELTASELPSNLRIHLVAREESSRADATGFVSPYLPITRLLLLEASDLPACLERNNLQILTAALGVTIFGDQRALALDRTLAGYWLEDERGKIMDVEHRIGQPVPPLDPGVIQANLSAEQPKLRPRFAVIETDRVGNVSHHATVSKLFLDGAKALGFEPVLGLHRTAATQKDDDTEAWAGFSAQVYAPGTADGFADELAQFIEALGLGPADVVFMHSLSPQIVLGTARYIAANPSTAPNFAMRFFATAEAMIGHKLSYVKILRSIESVRAVRRRMHFFCESKNLVKYYEDQVGSSYPLLFNPQHPSLTLVRESDWFDPALGGGEAPTLAYFGEAREEKGFEDVPEIVETLLKSESMSGFRFLLQTGSNSINDTGKIARAKTAISALKAKYPTRVKTFDVVDTSEQFYFLMKHAQGIIAPYKRSAYGTRGTGVTLEALQMDLDVFAWAETDLYATFEDTGRVIGVKEGAPFAAAIIDHYASKELRKPGTPALPINLSPRAVCERLLLLCSEDAALRMENAAEPVLWIGNDTFGEGCSVVYAAQKRALRELGRDCFEIFVPWPDPNWAGVGTGAYDERIYGFDSGYDATGLAWVAQPTYSPGLYAVLREIERSGPTYGRLRALNENFTVADTLKKAIANNRVRQTVLNYAHLYPVIEELVPLDQIICEVHDIMAYQHAVRRGDQVSTLEKIDELSDLAKFSKLISISAAELREISGACLKSSVYWRLPPYIPEPAPRFEAQSSAVAWMNELQSLGGVPDDVAQPSLQMVRTYYARPDLQSTFRLDTPDGRMAFFRWWFFFGQFEVADGFGLTQRQFEWSIEQADSDKLNGTLRLILSAREDLRRAFRSKKGVNIKALTIWARDHMEREFGFSMDQLAQRGQRAFAGAGASRVNGPSTVLNVVVESNPIMRTSHPRDLQTLIERLADVEQIDLALVGSSHPGNVASFSWFIEEVYFKYFASKGRNLFIVGSVCDALTNVTARGVFALGRCARLGPVLQASRGCPIPIVVGSGSPIKAIPALALNGSVTVTEHVDRAFGLADYGIPAFSEPRNFADDLWALLTDEGYRDDRRARATRYVEENLTLTGYIKFWEGLLEPGPDDRIFG